MPKLESLTNTRGSCQWDVGETPVSARRDSSGSRRMAPSAAGKMTKRQLVFCCGDWIQAQREQS